MVLLGRGTHWNGAIRLSEGYFIQFGHLEAFLAFFDFEELIGLHAFQNLRDAAGGPGNCDLVNDSCPTNADFPAQGR